MKHNIRHLNRAALAGFAVLASGFIYGPAMANNGGTVVTPEQLAAAQQFSTQTKFPDIKAQYEALDLAFQTTPDLEIAPGDYEDNTVPALNFDTAVNTDFKVGILSHDTADGKTYRDPYSIENINIDPIYPEGRYVDSMRATAGVDISSKF